MSQKDSPVMSQMRTSKNSIVTIGGGEIADQLSNKALSYLQVVKNIVYVALLFIEILSFLLKK